MGTLRVDIVDGVAEVLLDVTPLPLLNAELLIDLYGLVDRLENEPELKVAVFRSADPDFFLMHADVSLLEQLSASAEVPDEPNGAVAVFERLRTLPCATIGVLDGAARGGGCELLSALDMRIASTRAVVGQPEVALGILPGAGGTVRWARTLGRARALELLLSGRDMSADEALAVGWVQQVVEPEALDGAVRALVRRIARMPATSIAAIKEVVDLSLGELDDAILAETRALARLLGTEVASTGLQRFRAAGGQTREAEAGDFQSIVDATIGD